MADDKPTALLCDFGLAKIKQADPSGLTTSTFDQKGSPRYMSPELCNGQNRRSQSDMWAWACVLLEVRIQFVLIWFMLLTYVQMITDTIPYADLRDDNVVLLKVVTGVLPAKADSLPVPVDIQLMLECCWDRAVERPTAQECHELLIEMNSDSAGDEAQGLSLVGTHSIAFCLPRFQQKWPVLAKNGSRNCAQLDTPRYVTYCARKYVC